MTCGQRMKEKPVLFDVFQGPVESSVGIHSDIRGFPGCKSRRTLWPCVYIHGNPGIDRMGNETSSLRRDEFGHVALGVINVDPDRNSHIPESYYTAPFYGPSHMWFHPLLNHCFWGVFNIEMGLIIIFILPTVQQYKWGFYMFQLCFLERPEFRILRWVFYSRHRNLPNQELYQKSYLDHLNLGLSWNGESSGVPMALLKWSNDLDGWKAL